MGKREIAAYLAEIGSRGGSVTGPSKRRGGQKWKEHYRAMAEKAAKARAKKTGAKAS